MMEATITVMITAILVATIPPTITAILVVITPLEEVTTTIQPGKEATVM